ncbi:MAG: hypothetical protein AAF517_20790, partial [Planctomycetota bacterium]
MGARRRRRIVLLLVLICLGAAGFIAYVSHYEKYVLWQKLSGEFELLVWSNAGGLSEYRHRETGTVFVLIPKGNYVVGSADDDPKALPD